MLCQSKPLSQTPSVSVSPDSSYLMDWKASKGSLYGSNLFPILLSFPPTTHK